MKRKLTVNIIYLLLVVVLTWRIPISSDIRFNMNMMFMWLAVFSLGWYVSCTVNLWVGLFLCYAMWNANIHPTPESGAALLSVILGSILYLVFFSIFNKNAVITLFCLFAAANLFFIILQLSGWDASITINKAIALSDRQFRMGILDNRNSLSAAFAFCFPVIFFKRLKLWNLIPAGLISIGFVLAKTVGGLLAIVPAIAYCAAKYLSCRQLIIAVAIVLAAAFLYLKYVDVPNYKSRWAVWQMYGKLVQDPVHNKWAGIGLGHWKLLFKRPDIQARIGKWAGSNRPMYYQQAHNEFIQSHFEMGYIGLAIIIGYLVNVLRRVRNISDPRPVFILLAIIIDSFVYFPFHIPLLAVVMILGMSWLEIELRLKQVKSTGKWFNEDPAT